jgi:hypothetical protein
MAMRKLLKYTAQPPYGPFVFPADPGRIYIVDVERNGIMAVEGVGRCTLDPVESGRSQRTGIYRRYT